MFDGALPFVIVIVGDVHIPAGNVSGDVLEHIVTAFVVSATPSVAGGVTLIVSVTVLEGPASASSAGIPPVAQIPAAQPMASRRIRRRLRSGPLI
ncbi:MAG: hypothetical protein ACLP01_02205 [Solirubrobacteraceae bacterium]